VSKLRAGRYSGLCPVMALSLTKTLTDVVDGIHGGHPSRVSASHAVAAVLIIALSECPATSSVLPVLPRSPHDGIPTDIRAGIRILAPPS
jgi:hypothetical protein